MALTATVTKESVSKMNIHDYRISITVKIVNESNDILLEKTYSKRYFSGLSIDSIKQKLQNAIKADWDRLVAEDLIYGAVAFGDMCNALQSATNSYIN